MDAEITHGKNGKPKRITSSSSIQSTTSSVRSSVSSASGKGEKHHKTSKHASDSKHSGSSKKVTTRGRHETSIRRSQETNTSVQKTIPSKSESNEKNHRKTGQKKDSERDLQKHGRKESLSSRVNVDACIKEIDFPLPSVSGSDKIVEQSGHQIEDANISQDKISAGISKARPKVRRSISADVSSIQRKYRQLSQQKHEQPNASEITNASNKVFECWNGEPEFRSRKKSESDQNLHERQKELGFSGKEEVYIQPVNYNPADDTSLSQLEYDRSRDVTIDFAGYDATKSDDTDFLNVGYRRHGLKHSFPSAPYNELDHPANRNICVDFLVTILSLISAFIIFIPMAAILLIFSPICFLLKNICCCSCIFKNVSCVCCGEALTYREKVWLNDKAVGSSIVQCLLVVECGLDTEKVRDLINTRIIKAEDQSGSKLHPRFIQKVVRMSSGYKWVKDPNFQIKNHIFRMPATIETMEDLQEHISEMASRSLVLDHPLWEIQVLPNFGDQRDMILLVRMHPCFCDGVAFVKLLYKTIVDKETVTSIQPRFSSKGSLFSKVVAFLYGPLKFFAKCLCVRKDFNLLHGNHVHLSGKKVISWSEPYSLEAATRIKQVTRSTLNDVLISVAAGNMRNYLQINGVSNPYDMQCCLPVVFKSGKFSNTKGINYVMVNVRIPTNTEGSIPRLWQMKQNMENLQSSALYSVKRVALLLTQSILPECLCGKLWKMIYNKSTIVISNLPGPETTLHLASKKIKAMMFWMAPIHQVAVALSFFTYGDQIRMAVVSDRSVMPNPELLTKDFIFQMDQLSQLLANRRIPGEHLARRLEAVQIDSEIQMEQTVEQIQVRMAVIQQELHVLKVQLDTDRPTKSSGTESKLIKKIEQLKEQFRELLVEMRKKKASETESAMILSDEEHDDDEDREYEGPRRPFRRRAMSTSSKMSTLSVSSTVRPLAASEIMPEPEMFIDSLEKQNYRYPRERMSPVHTVRPPQQRMSKMDEFEIIQYPYSPSVERRYRTY